jgi:hypothetical protein
VRPTETQEQKHATVHGFVTVLARGRSAAEVVEDLMGTLAGEPRVVECDLTGWTAATATGEVFAPVGHYLQSWPGTTVLIRAPDPVVRSSLTSMAYAARMIIHTGWDDEALRTHRLLPTVRRRTLSLPPSPTAPSIARDFAAGTLQEWRLPALLTPASQVLGELVTHAVISADTNVAVSLSRVDTRIRIAVASPSAQMSASRIDLPAHRLTVRAQDLVQALARGWGVIRERLGCTTMWAVLDASPVLASDQGHAAGLDRAEPLHRGAADPDVLTELQGPPRGRHRRENRPAKVEPSP